MISRPNEMQMKHSITGRQLSSRYPIVTASLYKFTTSRVKPDSPSWERINERLNFETNFPSLNFNKSKHAQYGAIVHQRWFVYCIFYCIHNYSVHYPRKVSLGTIIHQNDDLLIAQLILKWFHSLKLAAHVVVVHFLTSVSQIYLLIALDWYHYKYINKSNMHSTFSC